MRRLVIVGMFLMMGLAGCDGDEETSPQDTTTADQVTGDTTPSDVADTVTPQDTTEPVDTHKPDAADVADTSVADTEEPDLADTHEPEDTSDTADGECNRAPIEVQLQPECVHVPGLVGAGGKFPIAVLGHSTGCTTYSHAEVEVSGNTINVKLVASEDLCGPCPACLWDFLGLIWLDAPSPGPYTVNVDGWGEAQVVASGGIIEEPACPAACAPPFDMIEWKLVHRATHEVQMGCGDIPQMNVSMSFTGECQTFNVTGTDWTYPYEMLSCTDSHLLFGTAAPYEVEATRCMNTNSYLGDELILGVANPGLAGSLEDSEVFVITGYYVD